MKHVLLYIPIVLSLATLGAHFMRYSNSLGMYAAVVLLGLLFVRQAWVARVVQLALVLGAIEWMHTLYGMAQLRVAFGQPYTRLVVILGVVATVTLGSALLFQTKELKKIYRL